MYRICFMGNKRNLPLPGSIKCTVRCWVWTGFRRCLHRASELTQASLSNIIRHIDSRVQCKSKQSALRWSCCIRILSVRHVNKHAVISTGHVRGKRLLVSSHRLSNCVNAQSFGWQTRAGGKKYEPQWRKDFVNRARILLGNSWLLRLNMNPSSCMVHCL